MEAGKGLGYLSAVSSVSSLLTGAIGSYWSAKSAKSQVESQARLSDINARIAELGAQQELIAGNREVGSISMQAGQLKSRQRVALSANGVDLGEGTAAELQASTDLMKEIDINTATSNAVRSAWGYRTQAVNAQNDALAKRATASGIKPGQAAFSSLLVGAGSVASAWYRLGKSQQTTGAEDFTRGWTSENYG